MQRLKRAMTKWKPPIEGLLNCSVTPPTKAYKKRTEIALEIVVQIEAENHFPQANYAFDNGVLSRPLTQFIESCGKHWVSEIECSRHIQWHGDWKRVDSIATELREDHPESFRRIRVTCRNGETKVY